MLELTEKDAKNRREIGLIKNINVRFFVILTDCETGDLLECELTESEFLEVEGVISYERHTVFKNGCRQICLTKSNL